MSTIGTITVAAVVGLIIGIAVGAGVAGLGLIERPRRWVLMAIRNIRTTPRYHHHLWRSPRCLFALSTAPVRPVARRARPHRGNHKRDADGEMLEDGS
jgi:hypothetical protein